ncbi:2Fe-2S iron-sulfur cluster-binding protein [Cupriavidus basilensis]
MSYRIHLLESQQSFEAAAGEAVLDGALRANVQMAHDCPLRRLRHVPSPGWLKARWRYGEYPMGLTPEEEAEGFALACQARPTSDLVIEHRAARRAMRRAGPRSIPP